MKSKITGIGNFSMKIILYFFVFLGTVFPQSGNWISIGGSGVALTRLHFNGNGDTLFAGTLEGYKFYSLYSSLWMSKEMSGYIGRTVWAVSTVPGRYSRVITGRVNAFFKGYIEVNDNFSIQGTIVRNSQGGKFTDIKYCLLNPDTVFACGFSDITPGDLVKSVNGGVNWTLLTGYLHTAMTEIAVNPQNNNIIFVSGDGKITKSTDYGENWVSSYNGLPSNLGCYTVAINPFNTQVLLTSNDNGIYRSSDGGLNCLHVTNIACRRITFHPNYLNITAAISFSPYKVLLSTNAGLNWADSTGTLSVPATVDLAFSRSENNLYVASSTSGVFKKLFTVTGVRMLEKNVPAGFSLKQNFPNPFNPITKIKFDIPEISGVKLAVYDMRGKEVDVLVNDRLIAGSYETTFSGRELPSGAYTCVLKAGDFRSAIKLILIK
ncbi:MAG: T9SS type A sorting domain-containing protein [Ignavibacteria bacterium]|nr:T9SS type A sorting domain-containing protein [Ignavibacteria bacterium]